MMFRRDELVLLLNPPFVVLHVAVDIGKTKKAGGGSGKK